MPPFFSQNLPQLQGLGYVAGKLQISGHKDHIRTGLYVGLTILQINQKMNNQNLQLLLLILMLDQIYQHVHNYHNEVLLYTYMI